MKFKKAAAGEEDNSEVFLDHKRKKKWVDKRTGCNCFMLYARSFYIAHGPDERYWNWDFFEEEKSNVIVEVARLRRVCWLEVEGRIDISDLSPGISYEVVFEVKLTKGATGWELPIRLKLNHSNGESVRQVSLFEKPRGEWVQLNAGNFSVNEGDAGELKFCLFEHGGHWKTGLIVKGAIIRPKS